VRIFLLALTLSLSLFADVTVSIETTSGDTIHGKISLAKLPMTTGFGEVEVAVERVESIAFGTPDVVRLKDGSVAQGTVNLEELAVESGLGRFKLKRQYLKKLTVLEAAAGSGTPAHAGGPPAKTEDAPKSAEEAMTRLEAMLESGDVSGAVGRIADPLGSALARFVALYGKLGLANKALNEAVDEKFGVSGERVDLTVKKPVAEIMGDWVAAVGEEKAGGGKVIEEDGSWKLAFATAQEWAAKVGHNSQDLEGWLGLEQRVRAGEFASREDVVEATAMGMRNRIAANEAKAVAALKQLVSTEGVWRQTDSDRNGAQDYWTKDIAAFYFTKDAGGRMLKYVDIGMAKADRAGLAAWSKEAGTPKAGYWLRVLKTDQGGEEYLLDGDGVASTNPAKYAFCAYPAEYDKSGVRTFIVNEEGVVYQKDQGPDVTEGTDRWPSEDPTTAGWVASE